MEVKERFFHEEMCDVEVNERVKGLGREVEVCVKSGVSTVTRLRAIRVRRLGQ